MALPGTVTRYRGRWRARVSLDGKRVSIGTFDTQAQAEGAVAEFWRLHATKVTSSPGLVTVSEWGRTYLDARETDGVHRSVKRDRSTWKARIDAWPIGQMCVDTLTPADVRAWVKEQIRTPSERTGARPGAQTVKNALNLLRVALEEAVEVGHCSSNPARDVRVPRIARDEEAWTWLREDEVDRLLSCADIEPERRRIYTAAIFTGLREGELWGLRWQDVDQKRAELTVCRSFELPTKGGKVRKVPLLAPALAAIKAQPRRCSLVFPTRDGKMRGHGDTAGLHAALELAKVRRVRFHDLRHTCASHLVQGTWAPELVESPLRVEEVRQWLGHQSVTTTERYAHLCPDAVHARVRRAAHSQEAPTRGLKWTHLDSPVPGDVAQLAETLADLEPPIRIERTTYGLRNGAVLAMVPGGCAGASPLCDQLRELLGRFGRGERPGDIQIVRALGEALAVLTGEERSVEFLHCV